jgi:hypothetical protein
MSESFFGLSPEDQLAALEHAAHASGRPPHLLEKDIWVVWVLQQLFRAPFGDDLVFKGGTSLSKAWHVIERFSEDIDLTYDIRAIAPDLTDHGATPLPASPSQEKKWSKAIRTRLTEWVQTIATPFLAARLASAAPTAKLRPEQDRIFIDYPALAQGTGYVTASVMLEFGARSTGEPAEQRHIVCDTSPVIKEISFPEAVVRAMRAERTFWEKATAIHVFCRQGNFRGGNRFSRHWHDVARLDEHGFADKAIQDRELARAVAQHKGMFFREKDAHGTPIDYLAAIQGRLQLVPSADARTRLAADYERMIADGLFLNDAVSFEALMAHCAHIERKINRL